MTPINKNDIGQAPRYFGSLWSGTQFFRMSHTDVLRKIASLHVLSMFWKLWTPRMVLSKFWDTPTFQMTIEKQFTPSKCHTLTSHTDKFTVCLKSIVFNFNLFFSFWLWTTQYYTLPCTRNQVLVSKSWGYPISMSQTDKKILIELTVCDILIASKASVQTDINWLYTFNKVIWAYFNHLERKITKMGPQHKTS